MKGLLFQLVDDMKYFSTSLCLIVFVMVGLVFPISRLQAADCDLVIGVTLHPYYSWVSNIIGEEGQVVPLVPSGADPHSYQPLPQDVERLRNLNVVVINGLGHDEFIGPMLKAINSDHLTIIDTGKGIPLIPVYTKRYDFEGGGTAKSYNSHTYISINGAIRQIRMISRELGKLCPDQAEIFKRNAREYSDRLRKMLTAALDALAGVDSSSLRIATVHDGYAYLFQELGIKVSAVVQPRHGIRPSARQLQDTIKRIKRAGVRILFAELDYEKKYVDLIFQETGCRIYKLSHVSHGQYTREYFEQAMAENLQTIVRALTEVGHER